MSERKTPWTAGPYHANWELGRIMNGAGQTVAYLAVHPARNAVAAKATGELLAEAPAMAELLRDMLNDDVLSEEYLEQTRALLARIGAP